MRALASCLRRVGTAHAVAEAPPLWSYPAVGVASGFFSGVLGIGGGGIVVLIFATFFHTPILGGVPLAASASWMVIVDAIPASQRPYIGGRKGNRVQDLVLGYNGFGRVEGEGIGGPGGGDGVVSREGAGAAMALGRAEALAKRPCLDFADPAPIRVEADLDLGALTAILVESDARRFADGFLIVSHGRYIGMGASPDAMRSLQSRRGVAAR